jgi:hypothetical protein
MAKIPISITKKEMRLIWFADYPRDKIRNSINYYMKRVNPNANIYDRFVNKQVIIYMIKEFGLPDFATQEDYDEYVEDSSIQLNDENQPITNINVEL